MIKGCVKFTPLQIVIFMTVINIAIYIDRGVVSTIMLTLDSEDEGMGLDTTEIGAIGTIFIVGYIATAPFFGHYAQTVHPLTLIAIGLMIWEAATIFTGFSRNFWQLGIARALSGAGEASFITISPQYILDNSPTESRTTWIALFFSGTFLGYSLGFIFGELAQDGLGAWYWPFFIEAIVIAIFILFCLIAQKDLSEGETLKVYNPISQVKILWNNKIFVYIVLGFSALIFTVGGISYWGPYIIEKLYHRSKRTSSYTLGILTFTTGISGTIIGSLLFDFALQKDTIDRQQGRISEETLRSITMQKATIYMFVSILIAMIVGCTGIIINTFEAIVACTGCCVFCMLLTKGPLALSLMSSVPTQLRGQANATALLFMHLFGDLPSPILIGLSFKWSIYYGSIFTFCWLIFAFLFWFLAWLTARSAHSKLPTDSSTKETKSLL